MSDPFIGEIKQTAFNFAPRGWALCDGQLLSIQQNQALFSLLGTYYGGNGITNFALPDLRGRVPMHSQGLLGQTGGEARHALTINELAPHTHTMMASATPSHSADPSGKVLGATEAGGLNICHVADGSATLSPYALSSTGNSVAHDNMQPYLVCNYIIAIFGIYPPRS